MPIEIAFLIGIVVLLFLALKLKVNAFMALLATALVIGVLSGMPQTKVIDAIVGGFSGTVKSIGIVIIFGIMLGNYLDASRGTTRMALDTIRMVGQKRSGIAMVITGYIVSIPVFSDAAFVILSPLVKAIAKKTKISIAILSVSLSAGLLATHVYVPPTPGPLAAAGMLGIDIGRAILYGSFAALFMALSGWLFAEIYFKNKKDDFYSYQETEAPKPDVDMNSDDLPGSLASIIPLFVPIILIILNTSCSMLLPKTSTVAQVAAFIGDANIALAIGALLAIATLGKRLGSNAVMKVMDSSLKDAGPIVFITAAGGALGQVLKSSGAGDSIAHMVINLGLPFILIPFVISALLKVVQGSGTVSVITAATLSAPIGSQLGLDPILIFLASGAGARACCHVNDSYFWVYTNCMGFDMKTGLKTLSISNIFMSLGGLLATYIASLWL
ncbi:GntP family permease [Klebsiella quasivariicola]|nr:gluconate:H+ symporter [Klebsiella quasivariicola]MBZ9583830.1 GntP family permease [Klebsiella quasivariicola]